MKNKLFYQQADICEMLGISKPTFFKWVKEGKIPALKIGRRVYITQKQLDQLVAGDIAGNEEDKNTQ